MQVSTTCRSTVNRWIAEACGSSRIRSHSGRTRSSAPVSSRVSHTAEQPAAGGQQPDQQVAGLGGPRARAASAPSRTSRAAVVGASDGVALGGLGGGAQQQQSGRRRAARRASSTTSPRETRDARRDAARRPGSGGAVADAVRASTASTRRQVSRERWRDPAAQARGRARCAASASGRPSALGQRRPTPPGRPGRWPGPATLVQLVAHVEQRHAGAAPGRRAARRPARSRRAP